MRRVLCVGIVALAALPLAASAQWSDNFDGYSPGSINGQGGWKGWNDVAGAAGNVVTSIARSGPHSQEIGGTADTVREYSGVNSGAWTYTAWQYIPGNFTGSTYFILLSTYSDGGLSDYSIQLRFDGASGLFGDDFRPGNVYSFVRDAWAEIRVEFDLTADTQSTFYNGALVSTGAWRTYASGTGAPVLNLAAVDLFANNASPVYYDDMSLVPAPAAASLFGLAGLVLARRRR